MVAEHSFEGDGFWTVVEEEVAPALTFGVDPDPCIGDPDDIEVGPQDLDLSFTWDVTDARLRLTSYSRRGLRLRSGSNR